MIAYVLLLYIGFKIVAPWWYFVLVVLGVFIKFCVACIRAASES